MTKDTDEWAAVELERPVLDEDVERPENRRSRRRTDGGAEARANARVARHSRQVAEIEARHPLRARILAALASNPGTPSALAQKLGAAPETISRQLRALRGEALVADEKVFGDGRQRRYTLTDAGVAALGRHRAFGAPQPPPPLPTAEETTAVLRSALDAAVELRRKTNQLGEAATRLRAVLEQARRHEVHDVALDAMAELATTLRQDRKAAEAESLLAVLDRIKLGQEPGYGPELVLPAAAHHDYALGRIAEGHGDDRLSVRAMHLVNAAMSYQRLSKAAPPEAARRWRQRQAWSLASLAINLREQSRLELAVGHAEQALSIFKELGDPYGSSHCLFQLGFCLRLMGDFAQAAQRLGQAQAIATAHGFERFEADALMQLGEVHRCRGDLPAARALLEDACKRARSLQLVLTLAFARSALGAVAYQEQRLDAARVALGEAQALFEERDHREGLALNARRQAIVARRLATAEHQSLEDVARFIEDAIGRYADLRSPAGLAACQIEEARLHLLREGRAPVQIAQLVAQLDETRHRLIELDPWVPYLLASFAREVDDQELTARTQRLLAERRRRLAEREAPSAEPPGESAARPAIAEAELTETDASTLEMGGEPRSEAQDGALASLAALA